MLMTVKLKVDLHSTEKSSRMWNFHFVFFIYFGLLLWTGEDSAQGYQLDAHFNSDLDLSMIIDYGNYIRHRSCDIFFSC